MQEAIYFAWWAWAIIALIFVFLEIAFPIFLFLGLAIAAIFISLLMLLSGSAILGGSVSIALLLFAGTALLATLLLRRYFQPPKEQVKTFENDINE